MAVWPFFHSDLLISFHEEVGGIYFLQLARQRGDGKSQTELNPNKTPGSEKTRGRGRNKD